MLKFYILASLIFVSALADGGLYSPADKVVEISEKSFPLKGVALIEFYAYAIQHCTLRIVYILLMSHHQFPINSIIFDYLK